jgi:hypothetical protein
MKETNFADTHNRTRVDPYTICSSNQECAFLGYHQKCHATTGERSRGGTWSLPRIRGPAPHDLFWRPVMCATQT